jgi:hypothetical protein
MNKSGIAAKSKKNGMKQVLHAVSFNITNTGIG